MKLYLVHCGFYDQSLADENGRNIFEGHHNFYVAAEKPADAKFRVKEKRLFKEKQMHVDGIHEITHVDGYHIVLTAEGTPLTSIASTTYDEAKTL